MKTLKQLQKMEDRLDDVLAILAVVTCVLMAGGVIINVLGAPIVGFYTFIAGTFCFLACLGLMAVGESLSNRIQNLRYKN